MYLWENSLLCYNLNFFYIQQRNVFLHTSIKPKDPYSHGLIVEQQIGLALFFDEYYIPLSCIYGLNLNLITGK